MLFDGTLNKWCSGLASLVPRPSVLHIYMEYQNKVTFQNYTMMSSEGTQERDPKNWTVSGSDDSLFIYFYFCENIFFR
jgi:hypothetical protein